MVRSACLSAVVAISSQRRKRQRGSIEDLPSGSLRVKVYAGIDPVSKHRRYLAETIPPGRDAGKNAEKACIRLLNQVDEKRSPRTAASLNLDPPTSFGECR
jgi:hypothetical protein